jgi:A/G-specific adenine glycosylase
MDIDVRRLRRDLLAFYDRGKRDLPWRRDADPYRVLVSEFMLQQTRVETVVGYYARWLQRFPDVLTLAEAPEDQVLKAWEGLGYYRRARSLHASARMIRDRWAGAVPSRLDALRALPGVGAYTAGAVASIAFGRTVAAVDGNVRRVLARWFDVETPGDRWLDRTATGLVDPQRPGDWNQALMELGATVCTPRSPSCASCPVAWACRARMNGTVESRPMRPARKAPRKAMLVLAILRDPDGAVLLERRAPGGLLAGMWAIPERELGPGEDADDTVRELARSLVDPCGADFVEAVASLVPLSPVKHRFTHIEATYLPWVVPVRERGSPEGGEAERRVCAQREDVASLALPVAQRMILEAASRSA